MTDENAGARNYTDKLCEEALSASDDRRVKELALHCRDLRRGIDRLYAGLDPFVELLRERLTKEW